MEFAESLQKDIEKKSRGGVQSFYEVLDALKNKNRIGIWGTGLAGNIICGLLKCQGIEISFFVDSDKNKNGASLGGIKIRSSAELTAQDFIIIAANRTYGIHKQLEAANISYMYMDPHFLQEWNLGIDVKKVLEKHQEQINDVYQMLADVRSKQVFRNILLHRAVHDLDLVWEVYEKQAYFGNDVVRQAKGCFVDCGAFQGDTLQQFLKQIGNCSYRYFAFEADDKNYHILKEYISSHNLKNVWAKKLGVWDKKDILYFQTDALAGDVAGKALETGDSHRVQILAGTIDETLSDETVDFIKMDIEGAEIRALCGAAKSIARDKPVLAVSAYHKLEHLWQVPLMVKELNASYQIYYRHHMWNLADTVCYGLP